MEWRKKITHPENCWSLRNHRAAENKKTEREMETQTSGSQEERGQRHKRHHSMEGIMPNFSDGPDDPVRIDSDVKTDHQIKETQRQCRTLVSLLHRKANEDCSTTKTASKLPQTILNGLIKHILTAYILRIVSTSITCNQFAL